MEQTKNSTTRFDNIDLIEFIAMFFVILYHASPIICNDIINKPGILIYLNYFVRPILSTCVPLFFFANGFLLLNKKYDLKKHVKKTFKLFVLTTIWGIITILFLMVLYKQNFSIHEFFNILNNYKTGWNNHLWYMAALICIYFFFPLIKLTFDNDEKSFKYWTLITFIFTIGNIMICMLATVVKHYVFNSNALEYKNYFYNYNPLRGIIGYTLFYFSIGGLVGKYHLYIKEKIDQNKYVNSFTVSLLIIISSVCLSLYGIFCSKLIGSTWDVVFNGYNTIFTVINVACIYLLCSNYKSKNNKINQFIKDISSNTLGIYFIHMIFIHLIIHKKLIIGLIPYNVKTIIGASIISVFIMTISYITVKILKKHPIIKMLF